jgi:hypothetical protein
LSTHQSEKKGDISILSSIKYHGGGAEVKPAVFEERGRVDEFVAAGVVDGAVGGADKNVRVRVGHERALAACQKERSGDSIRAKDQFLISRPSARRGRRA